MQDTSLEALDPSTVPPWRRLTVDQDSCTIVALFNATRSMYDHDSLECSDFTAGSGDFSNLTSIHLSSDLFLWNGTSANSHLGYTAMRLFHMLGCSELLTHFPSQVCFGNPLSEQLRHRPLSSQVALRVLVLRSGVRRPLAGVMWLPPGNVW